MDGLTEKEISAKEKIILPIWYDIDYKEILEYSPTLANKKAALSKNGLKNIVNEIKGVIHPQGSPLISARDMLIEWGVTPPVVTDKYWIDVIEASNRANSFGAVVPENSIWGRWSFPLPPKTKDAKEWGERLAWTAMQLSWTKKANDIPISPLTNPDELLNFIYSEPGLYETCLTFPNFTAEYAPQLTIRGFEGEFKEVFEKEYLISLNEARKRREQNSSYGSALTTDGISPECEESWALRHDQFGNYEVDHVTYEYFHGGMFGPQVSPYEEFEHLIWFLTNKSKWLPEKIHSFLFEGMTHSLNWLWGDFSNSDKGGDWRTNGALSKNLYSCAANKKPFIWKKNLIDDCKSRIRYSIKELGLLETVDYLFDRFIELDMPKRWIEQRNKPHKRKKQSQK